MKQLEKNDLLQIEAGAIKWSLGLIIGGGIAFVIGFIDGILRPLKCR